MDLVLIRHPAVAIDAGVCYGRSDIPLRASARHGATAISHKLATRNLRIDRLYSSPLTRCASVAMLLGQDAEVRVEVDARLAELDFGQWEQRRWDDVPRDELDAWAADVEYARAHGGESVAMCAERVTQWLEAQCPATIDEAASATSANANASASASANANANAGQPATVVVAHAGVIRLMTAAALGLPTLTCIDWTLDTSGVCRLTRARGAQRWALHFWND